MNNNYKIKNIGKTKTLIYNGTKSPKKNDIEWSIDYDNKHGVDLNVNMDNNGDKSHYHQYLNNSELEELLKIPVVDKSIHQRLLEDFDPYTTTKNNNLNNNNLDLITYPSRNIQPYKIDNDLMNYNQLPIPIIFQRSSELTKKSRPKVIKIKIYTKKHKKHKKHKNHKNHHSSKNRSKSSSRSTSKTM
jgi:hypothetical protein